MTKLIVVIGVTGNQGGSVAHRFSQDPNYHVRGLTRNVSSPAALKLSAQGIEIVSANLDSVESLKTAFLGANIIFSVTNYWEPFFRPDNRQKASEQGISPRRYAYDVEYAQGKNIADAAASPEIFDGLDRNGFIVSTLSHAGKCSEGRFKELYHFDAKADVFPGYVDQEYAATLKTKMSCVQTGYFTSSYKLAPEAYFGKLPDEKGFQMSFPTAPDKAVPHLAVNADMGNFVYAVSQMPPGNSYMAEGSTCSWPEYQRLWTEHTKVPTTYKQITLEEFIEASPDRYFGIEAGDMFVYSSDPGYDGGDETLLKAVDIRKAGIECPMTSLEEWIKKEDWSSLLAK